MPEDALPAIESIPYPLLESISEFGNRSLRIKVAEAVMDRRRRVVEDPPPGLYGHPIEALPGTRRFELLKIDTGGYTQPVIHFKILCLDHLIDVASPDLPRATTTSNEPPTVQ